MGSMAPSPQQSGQEVTEEAAVVLRRLFEVVESREIDADIPRARVLLRRLEGVLAVWETEGGKGKVT